MAREADAPVADAGARAPRRSRLKPILLGAVAVLGVAAAAQFGLQYWRVGRFMVSTDDAYVAADSTVIAPRVSGYIDQVLVGDNQTGQGRPGAGAHRRPRLPDGAAPGGRGPADGAEPRSAASTRSWTLQQSTIDQAASRLSAAAGRVDLCPAGSGPLRRRWRIPARAAVQAAQQTAVRAAAALGGCACGRGGAGRRAPDRWRC